MQSVISQRLGKALFCAFSRQSPRPLPSPSNLAFAPTYHSFVRFASASFSEMAEVDRKFHGGEAKADGVHPASHQLSDSTEGKHGWKTRPPYRVHEPNEHFVARYEASCHCGQVQYELSREEPLDSKLCHCTTCQKQHGKLHEMLRDYNFP